MKRFEVIAEPDYLIAEAKANQELSQNITAYYKLKGRYNALPSTQTRRANYKFGGIVTNLLTLLLTL